MEDILFGILGMLLIIYCSIMFVYIIPTHIGNLLDILEGCEEDDDG